MKKRPFCLLAVFTLVSPEIFAQPAFALPAANKMIVDPALTATDTAYKNNVSVYGKTMVENIPSQIIYNIFLATYERRLDKINSGIGIMINENTENVYSQISAKIYYRYTFLPGLSVGIDAGAVNLRESYTFESFEYYPPRVFKVYNQGTAFDCEAGISYKFKSLYAGFSIDHINNPQYAFDDYNNDGSKFPTGSKPMFNYTGLSCDGIIGGYIGKPNAGIDMSISYRDFNLDANISFVSSHFFVGVSYLSGNYFNYASSDYTAADIYNSQEDYLALMGGIMVCHKKIKASFAYSFYVGIMQQQSYPVELGVTYSF